MKAERPIPLIMQMPMEMMRKGVATAATIRPVLTMGDGREPWRLRLCCVVMGEQRGWFPMMNETLHQSK